MDVLLLGWQVASCVLTDNLLFVFLVLQSIRNVGKGVLLTEFFFTNPFADLSVDVDGRFLVHRSFQD